MTPTDLASLIKTTATGVLDGRGLDSSLLPEQVTVERPRNPEHGDYATNVAMQTAKKVGTNPREFATWLVAALGECDAIAGASAAVSGAHLTRQVDAIDVRTVVAPTLLVRETTSVLDAWSTPGAGTATLVVVDGTGRPLGVVSSTPADVPRERYATTPVSAVMVALPPQAVVEWHEELTTGDVVLAMGRSESSLVLVHWNGQYGAVTDRQIESRLGAH